MDVPEVGSEWKWNKEGNYTIEDVNVEVIRAKEDFIQIRVKDDDVIEESVQMAKKTLRKNGGDLENATECVLLAIESKGEIVGRERVSFFSLDKFYEEMEKA